MRLREHKKDETYESDRGWRLFLSHISAYRIDGADVWVVVDGEGHLLTNKSALEFVASTSHIDNFA